MSSSGGSTRAIARLAYRIDAAGGCQSSAGVVAPGFVTTERTAAFLDGPAGEAVRGQSPLGRVATPDEVAYAVVFLASEGAEFTTGTIIDVNGASYLRS